MYVTLLVPAAFLAAFGAYRRQHSRFLVTSQDRYRYIYTRPKEFSVGLSDVLLLLYGAMALQLIRTNSGTSTYIGLMVLHIPIILAIMGVRFAVVAAKTPKRGDGDTKREPKRREVFFLVLHRIATVLAFVLFATAPLVGLLLFGGPERLWLRLVLAAEILVVVIVILMPGVYSRVVDYLYWRI